MHPASHLRHVPFCFSNTFLASHFISNNSVFISVSVWICGDTALTAVVMFSDFFLPPNMTADTAKSVMFLLLISSSRPFSSAVEHFYIWGKHECCPQMEQEAWHSTFMGVVDHLHKWSNVMCASWSWTSGIPSGETYIIYLSKSTNTYKYSTPLRVKVVYLSIKSINLACLCDFNPIVPNQRVEQRVKGKIN